MGISKRISVAESAAMSEKPELLESFLLSRVTEEGARSPWRGWDWGYSQLLIDCYGDHASLASARLS